MAKKKRQPEELRLGLTRLAESGVEIDSPSPALVGPLKELFGKDRETDFAVAFALGKIADPAAVEALLELEGATPDKEVRKEIRRSLFRLGQRGIAIPERAEGAAGPPRTAPAVEVEAYMSPVDSGGGRLFWIARPHAGYGLQLLQAAVSDREGLVRVGGARMRRKELRAMMEEIQRRHGAAMVAVPWEYADGEILDAYEKARAAGRSGLERFPELRAMVVPGERRTTEHPAYARFRGEEIRAGAWREQSRRLLDEPEFRVWILDADWIEPFLPRLHEAQTSPLILNPAQKEERLAAIVREAVKAVCAPGRGEVLARRMEDMAYYLDATGRTTAGKLALAVALQVREGDPGPLDVSFLTGLVQKSFAFYLSEERKKSREEPSLIVKP
ncbi:MAG TPA: hypothetical protein VNN77_08175 [candidate division Zixibacteria bacterium]|nr:hypothetical protein [candidate division Zixibacteria bacterium]